MDTTPVLAAPPAQPASIVDGSAGAASGAGFGEGGNSDNGDKGKGDRPGAAPPQATTLFPARWVVQPGNRELGPYNPPRAWRNQINGWAQLACHVTRDYRLKDCRVLEESPPGYGFGAAVLNASHGFRVYPPKDGDRILETAWVAVRINFDYR
jgi:protein TonB